MLSKLIEYFDPLIDVSQVLLAPRNVNNVCLDLEQYKFSVDCKCTIKQFLVQLKLRNLYFRIAKLNGVSNIPSLYIVNVLLEHIEPLL